MTRIQRLISRMTAPSHCGRSMTWDVFRASYVCGTCGATQ